MTTIKTGPSKLGMHLLAIPAAVLIITFLGYSSQWFFANAATYLEPGPLSTTECTVFNTLLCCLWWSYFRACTVDPGRYTFDEPGPSGDAVAQNAAAETATTATTTTASRPSSRPHASSVVSSRSSDSSSHAPTATSTVRWCKKCDAPKPRRAHHCRHCRRCIPKMDHHCPWTGNCVSMQTFPHFLRFVVFTNLSLWTLAVLLARRFYSLYDQRHLPAYLGPTLPQLVHMTVLGLVCGATTLALGLMLYTTVHAWVFNTTMIEGWEIDRHEAVVDRYSTTASDGGWWDEHDDNSSSSSSSEEDEDGYRRTKARRASAALRVRVEFPYDLGFFDNMAQAMGTRNVLWWFCPLASGPRVAPGGTGTGWDWPENGFNNRTGMWPPPDPEKLRHAAARSEWARHERRETTRAMVYASGRDGEQPPGATVEDEKAAFQARQAADFRRRRQQQMADEAEAAAATAAIADDDVDNSSDAFEEGMDGERGWMNADGDRLRDYGVDEDAEDDDNVPLAQLLQRRTTTGAKAAKGQKAQ
ncbi:dhhc zinc finger membrane protein [Niveomyces insectorum RCEF 264]|uniref:Palmitoyltransferase PFA4 n=1 Tax=Niveomyces insectorum RCEF 264 TaxID=1081102 RepID=A0A167VLS1_9HYPO|nr:dhhc zinc finger membrane protein [Niveomyces insectorum RCEF 264]